MDIPYPAMRFAVLRFAVRGLRLRLRLRSIFSKLTTANKTATATKTVTTNRKDFLCGVFAVLIAVCGCGCGCDCGCGPSYNNLQTSE